jgi:hypothetical protein
MSNRMNQILMSALASAAIVANPLAAQAGGISRIGTYAGNRGQSPMGLNCRQPAATYNSVRVYKPVTVNNNVSIYKPTTIDTNINVYKPVTVDKNVNVTTNIDNSKNISINKPVSITTDIANSKNIQISKTIDNSKSIDASKNISISKNIVINKGGVDVQAEAFAAAMAMAGAGAGAAANASVGIFYGGDATDTATSLVNAEIGNLSVQEAATPASQPCTFQDATVVKAIHAVCVAPDGHEFPASHTLGDTWINSSYEGEIARCIPGSSLKVTIGKVTQSPEGLASASANGETLQCAPHEALRHYKNGVLKCAKAKPVPDCTERTDLRKYGSGDMFFTYRTRMCLETHEEQPAIAGSGDNTHPGSL